MLNFHFQMMMRGKQSFATLQMYKIIIVKLNFGKKLQASRNLSTEALNMSGWRLAMK